MERRMVHPDELESVLLGLVRAVIPQLYDNDSQGTKGFYMMTRTDSITELFKNDEAGAKRSGTIRFPTTEACCPYDLEWKRIQDGYSFTLKTRSSEMRSWGMNGVRSKPKKRKSVDDVMKEYFDNRDIPVIE